MEQKRLFLAIGLSLLVLIVWQKAFVPTVEEGRDIIPTKETGIEEVKKDNNNVNHNQIIDKEIVSVKRIDEVEKTIKKTIVKNNLYELELSSKGAVVNHFKLKNYKEQNTKNSKMKEVVSDDLPNGNFGLIFKNTTVGIDENTFYICDNEKELIEITGKETTLTYTSVNQNGIKVDKVYTFYPDSYLIDLKVRISNSSVTDINDEISVIIKNRMNEKSGFAFEGPSLLIDKTHEQIKVKKLEERNTFSGKITWAAIEDRYFVTGLINSDKDEAKVVMDYDENTRLITSRLAIETGIINSGTAKTIHYETYTGPKKLSVLKKTGSQLDKIVNFGWFDFIAKPCLLLMNYIHAHMISNYGIAIIILTIIFKIIFWPLGTKSYKSMNDMKKLQPLVAELREKYKNDKQKINQETMELYKLYKVNPLSGCLPMLVQLPIFFAFYRMLYSAIELRHAPFFGWIQDLSAPDRLGNFAVSNIPFFEPPIGIPVLTILMGASMFLQQKMSPPAGDPAQAKMMMMMPLFMTVIFVNFSSGLVLYWLVNNVVSIAQQYYVMKKNA